MSDHDQFHDVRSKWQGIFAGGPVGGIDEGLKAHNQINTDVRPEGFVSEFACGGCGQPKQVTITWPELIAIRCEISPYDAYISHPQLREYAAQWRQAGPRDMRYLGNGGPYWTPSGIRCGRQTCGEMIEVWFTPHECERYIVKGKAQGLLREDQEQVIGMHAMRMRKARGG